jgi:hypothetical protein
MSKNHIFLVFLCLLHISSYLCQKNINTNHIEISLFDTLVSPIEEHSLGVLERFYANPRGYNGEDRAWQTIWNKKSINGLFLMKK